MLKSPIDLANKYSFGPGIYINENSFKNFLKNVKLTTRKIATEHKTFKSLEKTKLKKI